MKTLLISLLISLNLYAAGNSEKQNPTNSDKTTSEENKAYDCSQSKSLACKPKNVKTELDNKVKEQEKKHEKALKDIVD